VLRLKGKFDDVLEDWSDLTSSAGYIREVIWQEDLIAQVRSTPLPSPQIHTMAFVSSDRRRIFCLSWALLLH
jgi:hypothetical protein